MDGMSKCVECGKMTDSSLHFCLWCNRPHAAPADVPKVESTPAPLVAPSKDSTPFVGIVVALAIAAALFITSKSSSSRAHDAASREPQQSVGATSIDALTECQLAIKKASLNSEAARVPYRDVRTTDPEFVISWPRGSGLLLQNEFGTMIESSASCAFDRRLQRITVLTINGKDVI